MPKARRRRSPLLSRAALLAALAGLSPGPPGLAGDWPQFRGPGRDGISPETGLLRQWPEGGPQVLWSVEVCQGYAGAAIRGDRVYFNDYDREASEWLLRCLSLEEGRELWRFREEKRIRPNHGITRTVPAADGRYVFSLDPKCVFHALDAETGKELWRRSFVSDDQARIPPWYAGQCPLLEEDRVILAPGGRVLVAALEKGSGKPIWESPNPRELPLSHSSVMPAEIGGVKQYLYATLKGVAGLAAADGKELWFFPRKFNVAMVPSPVVLDGGYVFLTSCYNSGSTMIRIEREAGGFKAAEVFTLEGTRWNSEVHTPIFHQGHLFAVGKKKRGLFTCLDRDGKVVWSSEGKASFGLGSYLLADSMFFALDGDTGTLRLIEASLEGYRELASAQVLGGHDVWAPMALADGKLVLRDLERMVCVQVGAPRAAAATAAAAGAPGS